MLSAVAARKASRKALPTPEQAPEVAAVSNDASPLPPSLLQPEVPRRAPKRKMTAPPTKKAKKRKSGHVEDQRTRYFSAGISTRPDGAVPPVDDVNVQDLQADDGYAELLPDTILLHNRPSSPSTPLGSQNVALPDSSDEELDETNDDLNLEGGMEAGAPQVEKLGDSSPQSISTLQLVWEQNAFHLSSEEIAQLFQEKNEDSPALVLVLAPSDTVSVLGTYTFTVVHGSVTLYGASLDASTTEHRVFAPRCSPVPTLGYSAGGSDVGVSRLNQLPQRILCALPSACVVIILRDLHTGVEGLGRICKTFDGVFRPSKWQADDNPITLGLNHAYYLAHDGLDIQPFILPSSWKNALSAVVPDAYDLPFDSTGPVFLVKGPKKTGKSTFARTLLNCLVTRYRRVAFLECDLGQSEFTPTGMASLNIIETPLFGPPFTHPTLPVAAHFIGSTTPRSSPTYYLDAIRACLQAYRTEHRNHLLDIDDDPRITQVTPLVVNTMGWTKGLGAELTRKIEEMAEPTDVFKIESFVPEAATWSMPPLNWDEAPPSGNTWRIHRLEAIPPSAIANKYSPADYRNLSILSYFHAIFPTSSHRGALFQQVTATSWDTSSSLCARAPYEVDWTVALDKVVLTGSGTEDVVGSEVGRVLNGAIIGLVASEHKTVDTMRLSSSLSTGTNNSHPLLRYTPGAPTPDPSTSTCHGLALIRSLSSTRPILHVLTPLPVHLLASCRVIVKGELELPVWGMLDHTTENGSIAGTEECMVPYLQWGKGEGLGGDKRRVRRNLMRRAQM